MAGLRSLKSTRPDVRPRLPRAQDEAGHGDSAHDAPKRGRVCVERGSGREGAERTCIGKSHETLILFPAYIKAKYFLGESPSPSSPICGYEPGTNLAPSSYWPALYRHRGSLLSDWRDLGSRLSHGFAMSFWSRYIACPFTPGCQNRIPKVLVCAGRSIPAHKGLLFRSCRPCNGFEWLSPSAAVEDARMRHLQQSSIHNVYSAFSDPSTVNLNKDYALDPIESEDTIVSENELDIETLACLHALYPDDYPRPFGNPVNDGDLALLLSEMPENFDIPIQDDNLFPSESLADLYQPVGGFGFFDNSGVENDNFSDVFPPGFDLDSLLQGPFSPGAVTPAAALSHSTFPDVMPVDVIPSESEQIGSSAALPTGKTVGAVSAALTAQRTRIPTKDPTLPQKINGKGKLECMARGCSKFVLTMKCGSEMCKDHCVSNGGCSSHGGGNLVENTAPNDHTDPWELSRPPPSIPPQPLVSSTANNAPGPPTSSNTYRRVMSASHELDWKKKKQAQSEVVESRILKTDYEHRYNQQVVVNFWGNDGRDPIIFRDQSIPTWPMYNMATSPNLLKHLALDQHTWLDVYNQSIGMWESQSIDRVFKVTTQAAIFIRRAGVTDCLQFEKLSQPHALESLTKPSIPKHDASEAFDLDSAPQDDPDPDTPSPKRVRHLSLSLSLSIPPQKSSLSTFSRRQADIIQLPLGCIWPQGVSAQDISRGFALMDKVRGDQASQFQVVFQGAVYRKATFSRHKHAWIKSTAAEHEVASSPSDLSWADWYKSSSGKPKQSRR
ncbi:hypothetical protein GALMADRAFT_213582 [Galerina marginata CBS 339.88]|uniref:Uncharacterized protein n=1 Tax=Galerina marginata (strain CBS 339.88) TaxID=685588 RepID=A0A067SNP7_GALM3|nr:hypothetical protein GALMADRAFT_213582 [Galerina marginata CBS 339.88]